MNFHNKVWEFKKNAFKFNNRHNIDGFSMNEHTSLFDICESLHMSNTGTSDLLPPDKAVKYCGWLMMRLESWHYTSIKYDEIVRELVKCTIEETLRLHDLYKS